jgi:uncharacterized protein (TIGR02284 family)
MDAEREALIQTLNNLIGACKDGENGFRAAADDVKNSELKALLQGYSQQRGQFVQELQAEVRRLGGTPEESGSLSGTLHRGWMNLKSVVTGKDDSATIAECERGEESARAVYDKALKDHLPEEVQAVVDRQFASIKEAHDRIRALEQVTKERT